MMKNLHKAIIALACCGISAVQASEYDNYSRAGAAQQPARGQVMQAAAEYEDFARVTNVSPLVEQVNMPRQECQNGYAQVQQPQERSVGGALIGGIAGGLLGAQVGRGNGRTAAAAVGAATGALVGDRVQNDGNGGAVVTQQPVRQCRMVDHWESRNTGYNVTYEYRGRSYTSLMSYDPGEKVRLAVTLTPR